MTDAVKEMEACVPEVLEQSALAVISKAEIDVQISTAHQYPRSMQTFKRRALEMVTLDEETAASCIYRRPVGKKPNGSVEYAEGMSVRMAEIVGACYGNLRVGAQLIEQTPRQVKARGFAHDLESNFASTSEVVESTVKSGGGVFSERMATVVAKAAVAKARRDATFQVVPRALCKALEGAARKTAIGTEATIGKRRSLISDWINKLGIDAGRVWSALGINGIDDVGLVEMETLTGIRTALKDGDTTIDEAFPSNAPPTPNAAEKILDKIKGKNGTPPPAAADEPPPAAAVGENSERTIEDEIREVGEALEIPEADTAKRIKTMAGAGKLDTLRDNYRLELKKKQAKG